MIDERDGLAETPAEELATTIPDEEPAEQPETDEQGGEGEADEPEQGKADDPEPDDDEQARKRTGSQRLKRENERLRAELARFAPRSAPTDEASLEAAVDREVGPKPRTEDFRDDWEGYQAALSAWHSDRRQVTRELRRDAQRAEEHHRETQRARVEDYQDRRREAVKAIPDYERVIRANQDMPVSRALHEEILESEKGPLIAYHLAKNPEEAARLNDLSPREVTREIARLEGRLSLPKPRATMAAPPIAPPRGAAAAPRSPERMPMGEFAAFLNKEMAKARV